MTEDQQHALDYLAGHNVMTLATCADGKPWAAAVFYVSEGFELFFLSMPDARHSSNIAINSRAAVTIQEDYADWREIKGIQLEGRVELLAGEAARQARETYATKFPITIVTESSPVGILSALSRAYWYRLTATSVYLVDNARGFGKRIKVL